VLKDVSSQFWTFRIEEFSRLNNLHPTIHQRNFWGGLFQTPNLLFQFRRKPLIIVIQKGDHVSLRMPEPRISGSRKPLIFFM
jgi:hypothetical protein